MAQIEYGNLVFYTKRNGVSFFELTSVKPFDVAIDLGQGKWQYLPKDKNDPLSKQWFTIGEEKNERARSAQFRPQDSIGTVFVFDRTQLEHLKSLESIAFQIGSHS